MCDESEKVGVMKKVLIFGISGFVGMYLTKEFHLHGYSVVGSDIVVPNSLEIPVAFHAADLLDASAVSHLVKEVAPDVIVNLAAISSVGASWGIPQTTILVNVIGALNIMEAVREHAINTKILFVGSSEEYDFSDTPMREDAPLNAKNPYGISKMTQERFAQIYREQYGMKIYYVRPFNHTGIGQKETFVLPSFCKQVAAIECSGKPGVIKVGNLIAKRDFSDVRDIVRAYALLAQGGKAGETYNVGSGKSVAVQTILEEIIALSCAKITVEVDPVRLRPVDVPEIRADIQKLQAICAWTPEIALQYTLQQTLEYWRATVKGEL